MQAELPYQLLSGSEQIALLVDEQECYEIVLETIDEPELFTMPVEGSMVYFDIVPFEYEGGINFTGSSIVFSKIQITESCIVVDSGMDDPPTDDE